MRSLFLKVFLWFWLAMVVVIATFAVTTHFTRTPEMFRPPPFIEAVLTGYGRDTVATYEREGAAGLKQHLDYLKRETGTRNQLFDASGTELTGAGAPPQVREIAMQVAQTGIPYYRHVGGEMLEVRFVEARDGGRYAFVSYMPMGPPPVERHVFWVLSETAWLLLVRVLAAVLAAGALCWLLARYMVAPVVKLREVTRQVTGGDLSARVGPRLGGRRDELAAMGHDFDELAARIETLVGAQTRLLRDISHELRSPLARLSVALDLARKRAGPAAAGDHDRIEREAKRLNEMIGQLLALSRWESDGDRLRAETFDLSALVREVAADADFEAQGRNCSVIVEECDACMMRGTPQLIRSAVENVVRNAVRYTPEETAVKISLRCRRHHNGGEAVLTVRDEGSGVPAEFLQDIFRPFYRMDDSRTRETGGTGLGLAITERAVRLHGGTVRAENISGGGFVVELRLPFNAA